MDDKSALALFARELQAARAKAGLSRDALAGEINYSPALVGMIETCRRVPSLDFARRCDGVLGVPGTFERMQEFVRTAPFPAWFRPFVEYEAVAKSLRGFEHVLIPGLLQTPEYARAVLACYPDTTPDKVGDLVTARMDRQAILDRDDPPRLWVVLDESALHRDVGGPDVMHEQLRRVADLSERPNITVQIIPDGSGGHIGLLGAFVVADFHGAPSVSYLETSVGGQIAEEPSVVAQAALNFDTLRSEALPRGASRDLILKVAEKRWT